MLGIANQTLLPKVASWIFGANIPGKKQTVMFFLGGLRPYRELLAAEKADGYPGFLTSAGGRNAASIISEVTRPKRRASAWSRFSTA